jgi:hypothetical protein
MEQQPPNPSKKKSARLWLVLILGSIAVLFLWGLASRGYQRYQADFQHRTNNTNNEPTSIEWQTALREIQGSLGKFGLLLGTANELRIEEASALQRSLEQTRIEFESIKLPDCAAELRFHTLNSMRIAESAITIAAMGGGVADPEVASTLKRSNDEIVRARAIVQARPCG